MEYCPDWFDLIQVARYMRVAPWELIDQHPMWVRWGRAAQEAEAYARAEHAKRHKQPIKSP